MKESEKTEFTTSRLEIEVDLSMTSNKMYRLLEKILPDYSPVPNFNIVVPAFRKARTMPMPAYVCMMRKEYSLVKVYISESNSILCKDLETEEKRELYCEEYDSDSDFSGLFD